MKVEGLSSTSATAVDLSNSSCISLVSKGKRITTHGRPDYFF